MNCLLIREWEGDCRAEALWKLCLLPLGALLALVLLWKDCPGMTACLAISQLALAGLALGGHCWSVNVRRAVVDLVLLTPLLALVA